MYFQKETKTLDWMKYSHPPRILPWAGILLYIMSLRNAQTKVDEEQDQVKEIGYEVSTDLLTHLFQQNS